MTIPFKYLLTLFMLSSIMMAFQTRREKRALRNTSDELRRIQVDRAERTYVLHLPGALDKKKPVPLVLVFHGGGGHAFNMPKFTGFDEIADQKDFIVAYPESFNQHWSDGRGLSPADDTGFIRALIAELQRTYPVDPKRVYAAGISNGGFFSNRLACDLADKIAAIASVAATMPEPLVPACHPARPVSVMYMHGTKDPLVPINGGPVARTNGTCISLTDAAGFWRKADHTADQPLEEDLPNREADGTSIHRETWKAASQGTEVVVYTIKGGGHTWPGGMQYLPAIIVGKVTHQMDATPVIWEFFSRHSL
jgi:polyhydroxybutyrate depolymerase